MTTFLLSLSPAVFHRYKQYTPNIRLCIVHILNAIELSPDLGLMLLRTFKVERENLG